MQQNLGIFACFSAFCLQIKQNCLNLASYKLEFLRIGLMYFRFLKACESRRLWSTFWSQVGFTIHANKINVSQNVPKQYCFSVSYYRDCTLIAKVSLKYLPLFRVSQIGKLNLMFMVSDPISLFYHRVFRSFANSSTTTTMLKDLWQHCLLLSRKVNL